MQGFTCAKCNGTEYSRKEVRTEGGLLSTAFDVSTNRFIAVSCENCGYTEFYRDDPGLGSKIFDFLVT